MSLNPLFWLHLRIGGSTRTNVVIVVVFVALIITFASISFYVTDPQDHPQVNAIWLTIMTAAQAVFLLLIAPSAVRRAVQRDFDSGMIESHRLSPMSNLKVILGYLTGAPVQAALMYAVSLVFGSYFAARYALSPGLGGAIGLWATLSGWYFAQVCMLILSLMIGALILLSSLATRGKANVVGIVAVIGFFGGWVAVAFVPGIALLLGVMSGGVLIGLITSAKIGGDASVIVVAAFLQLIFSIIVLAAACGQLRAPERSLFSVRLGLILLLVWGFTLVTGIHVAPKYDWLFSEWCEYAYAQLIASTGAFILIGFFPLFAAAVNRFHSDRAAARRCILLQLVPPLLAALTVLCLYLMLRGIDPGQLPRAARGAFQHWPAWTAIATALLLSFWNDFQWMYVLKALTRRPVVGLLIMLFVLKGVPLMLDGMARFFVEGLGELRWSGHGYLTGLSPIGTLILAPKGGMSIWIGLVVQAALAVGATLLARRARRRLTTCRPTATPVSQDLAALVTQPISDEKDHHDT